MALGEYGIIFHDLFVDEELFIPNFKEYYEEKRENIERTVSSLLSLLNRFDKKTVTKAMATEFKEQWDQFQIEVLGNQQPLELLVAYRDNDLSRNNIQFSTIVEQREVEETVNTKHGYKYGINSGNELITESFKIIQARGVEKFLQKHLGDLMNQLYYDKIDRSNAEKLHDYHSYLLPEKYSTSDRSKREHITGLRWHQLFYQNMGFQQWQGNAYEAYFNHMAKHEPAVFDYLSKKGTKDINALNFQKQRKRVFVEEGGETYNLGNFPKLMFGQQNSIAWYAGGDIVIVNNKGQVVYNIQLKTTTSSAKTVFEEKVVSLRKFLKDFVSAQTVDEKAKLLFDNFKNTVANSQVVDELGEAFRQSIEEGLIKRIEESIRKN